MDPAPRSSSVRPIPPPLADPYRVSRPLGFVALILGGIYFCEGTTNLLYHFVFGEAVAFFNGNRGHLFAIANSALNGAAGGVLAWGGWMWVRRKRGFASAARWGAIALAVAQAAELAMRLIDQPAAVVGRLPYYSLSLLNALLWALLIPALLLMVLHQPALQRASAHEVLDD
jgi:hypothetical protein